MAATRHPRRSSSRSRRGGTEADAGVGWDAEAAVAVAAAASNGSCNNEDPCQCSCSEASASFADDDRPPSAEPDDGTFSLDVFSRDFTDSPVYRAIVRCRLPALYHAVYCLRRPATTVDANFGVNFIHLTVSTAEQGTEAAFEPFVYALSNFRADVNHADAGGDTPLLRALRRGLPGLVRALLRCGARRDSAADAADAADDPGGREARAAYDEFSPGLWRAVEAGDYFLVDRLLASWCRVRVSDDTGESLIGFARRVGAGSLVVELLEGSRATLEFTHAALAGDSRRMAQLLANRNVNVDVRDRGYRPGPGAPCQPRSLRDTAVAMGHGPDVLRLLPGPSAGRRRPAARGSSVITRPASAVCVVM